MTISIAIIGHREVDHVRALLPTLAWADDVVYVDCESGDGSADAARELGARVFERPNDANLNVNKSFAIEQTTGDWVFYLDPDERLPEALVAELRRVAASDTPHAAFELPRRNHVLGRWLQHGRQYPDLQLRFFRRGRARFANRHVHERLQVDGTIGRLQEAMHHFPYDSIAHFWQKSQFYTSFEADYLWKQGVRPSFKGHVTYLVVKPATRFLRRYLLRGGYRDGLPGLTCCVFDAINWVVRWLKLWERAELAERDGAAVQPCCPTDADVPATGERRGAAAPAGRGGQPAR